MTTATTEGRSLVLAVDGIDEPFRVDPISAKRGRYLTERFVQASLKQLSQVEAEQIFIECIGPANYSRMTGVYVDVITVLEHDPESGAMTFSDPHITFGPDGATHGDATRLPKLLSSGAFLTSREGRPDEPEIEGELRQEEGDTLALVAFYWQTVVGMEGVKAILEEDGSTRGSLKALGLLQIRLGHSPSANSSSQALESSILQQAGSEATSATRNSTGSVLLPANKRGFGQNPARRAKPRRR